MQLYKAIALASLMAICAFTPAARACSVTQDYVRPTNFELVQMADAIVVATAMKEIKGEPINSVEFRVDKTLKGTPPKTFVDGFGLFGPTVASDPNDIAGSHPEGHAGPCNRTTFVKGKQYVVFLVKDEAGKFHPGGPAFSRINEDYAGEDSLWVRTVRTYLDIQRNHGPMEQLAVLEQLLQQKLKGPKTTTTNAEAQDILDHLRSRSPWKPTEYLVETFETLERGHEPKYGVRSRMADRENSPAQDLTDLLTGQKPPPNKMARGEEMYLVLRSLVLGKHPTATKLFDRLIAATRVSARTLGFAIRFYARNGQYRRAYSLIESRATGMLLAVPQGDAIELIANIYEAQRGDNYGARKERWRSDPYVAKAWPELDLHLYWLQFHSFGEDHALGGDAAAEIPIADYRARPLLTLALRYNEGVQTWAVRQLLDETKRKEWDALSDSEKYDREDPAWLPLQVLVRAFGEERDEALKTAACQGRTRRHLLIAAIEQWGGMLDIEWIAGMAAVPNVDAEERELLAKAAARMFARRSARPGDGLFGLISGASEYELLEQIVARKPIKHLGNKVTPLLCINKKTAR